jgi:hypothetical protein
MSDDGKGPQFSEIRPVRVSDAVAMEILGGVASLAVDLEEVEGPMAGTVAWLDDPGSDGTMGTSEGELDLGDHPEVRAALRAIVVHVLQIPLLWADVLALAHRVAK